jgi:hypothetical protein
MQLPCCYLTLHKGLVTHNKVFVFSEKYITIHNYIVPLQVATVSIPPHNLGHVDRQTGNMAIPICVHFMHIVQRVQIRSILIIGNE